MPEQTYLSKTATDAANPNRDRLLPFSGAQNFRDLGGYQTTNGKTIRWGLLYRSDRLSALTISDYTFLKSLSLDRIIDFRTDWEKQMHPDRLPADMNVRRIDIPILDSSTKVWRDLRGDRTGNLGNLDPTEYMIMTYIELGTRFTPEMRSFLQELFASNGSPVLFHCTAGKDRTGFASAILLRMLGVPQETIMEDYLLTNKYLGSGYKWNLLIMRLLRGKRFVESINGFIRAHPTYLSAAFEAIDRECETFGDYVRAGLGLNDNEVERLKELYLE